MKFEALKLAEGNNTDDIVEAVTVDDVGEITYSWMKPTLISHRTKSSPVFQFLIYIKNTRFDLLGFHCFSPTFSKATRIHCRVVSYTVIR